MKYSVVIVAIIHKNFKKVLLARRAREPFLGKWSLLGGAGALENEPEPQKAINNEILEDIGVRFSGRFFEYNFEKHPEPTLCLYFYGTIKGKPVVKAVDRKTNQQTISEIKWFDIDNAVRMPLAFQDKKVLMKFKKLLINPKTKSFA